MNLLSLFDGTSVAVVFGGTAVATVLRCGWRDSVRSIAALGSIGAKRFDADRVRSELALQVQEIHRDGILRAEPHAFGDREFDEAAGVLIGRRSVSALLATHEAHKARREAQNDVPVRTFAQAAELAPVFGLAGTLLSLTQLPRTGVSGAAYADTISMAVLTTLYGLLLCNIILAPLSRAFGRAADAEEEQRQQVVDWLAAQVAQEVPVQPAPVKVAARSRPMFNREAA